MGNTLPAIGRSVRLLITSLRFIGYSRGSFIGVVHIGVADCASPQTGIDAMFFRHNPR